MKLFIIMILFLNSANTYAYKHKRCTSNLYQPYVGGGGFSSLFTSIVIAPTSTSQYVSSTGSCSALASAEKERIIFYADNYEHLKKEIAKGSGEYLVTFSKMSGCQDHNQFNKVMKENYLEIYGFDLNKDRADSYEVINDFMIKEKTLKCNLPYKI